MVHGQIRRKSEWSKKKRKEIKISWIKERKGNKSFLPIPEGSHTLGSIKMYTTTTTTTTKDGQKGGQLCDSR